MSGEIDDPDRVWMKAEVSNMMKMESMFHSNSGASAFLVQKISQRLLRGLMFAMFMFHLHRWSSIELYGVNHQATAERQVTELKQIHLLPCLPVSFEAQLMITGHFIIVLFCWKSQSEMERGLMYRYVRTYILDTKSQLYALSAFLLNQPFVILRKTL